MIINKADMLCLLVIIILGFVFANFSIVVFGLGCLVLINAVTNKFFRGRKEIINSIYLSWLIEIAVMLIIYYVYMSAYGVPYDMQGTDDYYADTEWSEGVLNDGIKTIQGMVHSTRWGLYNNKAHIMLIVWVKIIAKLLGGYHTLDIRLINLTFCILAAVIMGQYANRFLGADDKEIRRIILLIALLPNVVFIASPVYRDVYVAFLIALSFYLWAGFKKRRVRSKITIVIVSLFILYVAYYLRMQSVLYIVASIFVGYSHDRCGENYFTKQMNPRKVAVFIAAIIFVTVIGTALLDSLEWYFVGYTRIHMQNSNGMEGRIYSIPVLPFGWLVRTAYYLLLPMYWRDILPFAAMQDPVSLLRCYVTWGTILLVFSYPYLFRYLKKIDNICVMFIILLLSTAVLTSGFRHIMMVYPFMLTICVVGRRGVSYAVRQDNLIGSGILMGMMAAAAIIIRTAMII